MCANPTDRTDHIDAKALAWAHSPKPTEIKASWIGELHAPLLLKEKVCFGEVVCVFNKTLNIKTYNGELVVVIAGSLRSPINVNILFENSTSTSFKEFVKHGSQVSINDCKLVAGSLIISLKESKRYSNCWDEPTMESLRKLTNKIGQVTLALNMLAREGSLINPDNTTRNLLSDFLNGAVKVHLANEKSIDKLSLILKSMCGLGPGFTPAGDDFIMGYLAMHNRLSVISGLNVMKYEYEYLRKYTNWISTKMVQYSQRSLHDEVVELALNSVAKGDVNSYISALMELGPRGHTSGIDMATGMTISMCVISDYLFGSDHINECRKSLLS